MWQFGEFISRHLWMLIALVLLGSLMGYLAYGIGAFDHIPFTYPLNEVATIALKWLTTPALIAAGLLSLLLLLLIVGNERHG